MNKTDILLQSINTFFTESANSETLIDVLEKRKGVSLRTLEWFITNYSKKTNLTYTNKNGKKFAVHCAYKSSLDGYSKKLFDPFCRTEKIEFNVADKEINTTVAQLNFIRWCIKNNIIEYIINNKENLLKKG
jgi:hypothetical protein